MFSSCLLGITNRDPASFKIVRVEKTLLFKVGDATLSEEGSTTATLKALAAAVDTKETGAALQVAEAAAYVRKAEAGAAKNEDEDMGVVVYCADAAWREVYNDAEADTSDTDTDAEEEIDVGEEETSWSTAAVAVPAARGVDTADQVPAETAAAAGEHQHVRRERVDGEEEEEGRPEEGEGQEDSEQEDSIWTSGLVANAMALADAAEHDAGGLYEGGDGGGRRGVGGERFHTVDTGIGDKEYASQRGGVRNVVTSGVFGTAKSAPAWNGGGDNDGDGGDAEREAEEVQALVAEALALVMEANEDT